MNKKQFHFSVQYPNIVRSIVTPGEIYNPVTGKKVLCNNFVWDTGATKSALNMRIVKQLKLSSLSLEKISGVLQEEYRPNYLIDVGLPNKVKVSNLNAVGLDIGCDFLIGMDIISKGIFSFVLKDGKSLFSFSLEASPF